MALFEINGAVDFGLIEKEVLKLIGANPERTELVLTGRDAHEWVKEAANLVSEVREVKYYFREGVDAREGIER